MTNRQQHVTERRVRRLASHQGQRLWKVSESSRQYAEYGPYALVDLSTTAIGPRGLTLDEVESWLVTPTQT